MAIEIANRVVEGSQKVYKALPGGQLTELADPQKRQQEFGVLKINKKQNTEVKQHTL